jgi:hypothetical protein
MGKFVDGAPESEARVEDALRRALAINPRLSIAPKFYANLEADTGHADRAVGRLLSEATHHGMIRALRRTGARVPLLGAVRRVRLDPNLRSGVEQTLLLAGRRYVNFQRALIRPIVSRVLVPSSSRSQTIEMPQPARHPVPTSAVLVHRPPLACVRARATAGKPTFAVDHRRSAPDYCLTSQV